MDHRRNVGRASSRRHHRRGGRHELADSSIVGSTGMGSEGVPEKLAAQRHSWARSPHCDLRSVDLRARGIPAIVVAGRRRAGRRNRHRSSPDSAAACPHHPLPGPRTIGNDVRSVRGRSPVPDPGVGRAVLRRRLVQDRPTRWATHNRRPSQSWLRVPPRPALVAAHLYRCPCACRFRRMGDRDAARLKRLSRRASRRRVPVESCRTMRTKMTFGRSWLGPLPLPATVSSEIHRVRSSPDRSGAATLAL